MNCFIFNYLIMVSYDFGVVLLRFLSLFLSLKIIKKSIAKNFFFTTIWFTDVSWKCICAFCIPFFFSFLYNILLISFLFMIMLYFYIIFIYHYAIHLYNCFLKLFFIPFINLFLSFYYYYFIFSLHLCIFYIFTF